MKQNLQKRRLTTDSHDLRCIFSLLVLATILSASTLPALSVTAEDQAEIRDLVNRGNGLMNAGRYKEALEEYEAVLRIDPENHYGKANRVLTHNKWALSLFRQNKFKEARQHWDIAHKLNPSDPTVNQNLKVLEFRLKQLGIDEEAEEKQQQEKAAAASGAAPVFDPLRESPTDWSPFPRAKPQANPAQTPQRPTGGAFNVGGGMPPAQTAQGAPQQQAVPPAQTTQSGPQIMGGASGSPSAAPSGPMVVSGGTTSGVQSSGPVVLNGSASGGPAASSEQTSEPGAVSNYGGTFTLSAGTSNTESSEAPEDDFSAVKIVGGAPAPAQGVNEAHEGLPFTESSPAPGNTASSAPNVPAGGYAGNPGPAYEAASHTAQGQAIASNSQGAPAGNSPPPGNPASAYSSPSAGTTGPPPVRSYITGQQAYGGAPVNNYQSNSYQQTNSPPTNNYQSNAYQPNNYQSNSYQSNSNPPANAAPSFEPARNVNMSFGTTGNVVIPPPTNRHGTGTAYKFPTNVVPPRAAPGFLGEAPPSSQASTPSSEVSSQNSQSSPSPSYSAASGGSTTSTPESTESYNQPTNTPSRPAATEAPSDNSAATVNKILTEIEKKVYGKTSETLPILKRLERIEIDTLGHKVTGPINERLNKLKETYGL